mgnify:CR=1 FL=1
MGPYRRFKYLTLFLTTLWSSLILTSCATLSGCNSCTLSPSTGYTKPYNPSSFTLIEVSLKLEPTECIIKGTGEKCDNMLSVLPPKTVETRGSGTVVKVSQNKTYVLTADHVCSHPGESKFEMPYFLGNPEAPRLTAIITVKQTTEVTAVDGDGISHKSVVHATDALNDVCIIRSDGGWGIERVVPVASSMPKLGSRVYNLAAPFGIFEPGDPGVKLHFEGRYSGNDVRGNYFYTIPARPGSSGSSVLNEKGEVIGVIHSAMIHFEHVALASSLTSIQALMATIPVEEVPDPHQEAMHHFIFGF